MLDITNEQLEESFNTWWDKEGKFITPNSSDWNENKRVMLIAWINGAYIANTYNTYMRIKNEKTTFN